MESSRSGRIRWMKTAVKLLIVALVLWFVRRTLVDAWRHLEDYEWRLQPAWLIPAGAIYLLGLLPPALFWYRVLRVLGQQPRLGETLRAYYIGHLGKYVPGKAMVVVIRTGLIRSQRVRTGVAAVSVFVETLTMMAVGAFVAAAFLAARVLTRTSGAPEAAGFADRAMALVGQHFLLLIAVGLMVVAGLPTLPPIFRRLVRLAGVGRSDPETAANVARLGFGTLALGWLLMFLAWGLLGLSFWAVLRAMGVAGLSLATDLPLYTAGVALAMVAGFLSLIPGGAVVREAILTELMVGPFGEVVAVVSALLLRLIWLLSELAISVILYAGGLWNQIPRRPKD